MNKPLLLLVFLTALLTACDNKTQVDFVETVGFETIALDSTGYACQSSFVEHNLVFENSYNAAYQSFMGFACSSLVDTVTAGYTNQLSASTGHAYAGSNFAVLYGDSAVCKFKNDASYKIRGLYMTNSTFAYLDMRDGSAFSKQFADGDWFKIVIKGYADDHSLVGTREVYLADFREGKKVLLNEWGYVPFDGFISEKVQRLEFFFDSSDKGDWGVNTPQYACIDNVLVVR